MTTPSPSPSSTSTSPNMIKKYGQKFFCSDSSTELNQIVFSFAIGLLFGPISWGLAYFIAFIIIYEIIVFYITSGLSPKWRFLARLGINAAAILGWIIGRWLVLGNTGFEWFARHVHRC